MTTTITIKTHDWPVRVAILDESEHDDVERIVEVRRTIPPHATEHFHLSSGHSLSFREMPLPEGETKPDV